MRETSVPFPLWDFADYTDATTEALPPAGDTSSRMRWYWESSHYTEELGRHVLGAVFGTGAPGPPGFGVELDGRTIERHLAEVRDRGAAWRESHGGDVADIARLAAEVRAAGVTVRK